MLRLIGLVRPYTGLFLTALIALALGSAVNLYIPELIRHVLNSESPQLALADPTTLAFQLVALFAFQGICFYVRIYCFGLVGQKTVTGLRQSVFTSIISRPIEAFDREKTGDLLSRLTSDVQSVQDAVSIKLSVIIRYTVQVIGGTVLMAILSPRLTAAILVALVFLVFFSMFLGKRLKVLSKTQQTELGSAAAVAEEAFMGIRVIKAFVKENVVSALFSRSNNRAYEAGVSRTSLSAFFQSFVSFLLNAFLVMVLLYGIALAARNMMSVGDLTSFFLYGVIVAVSFAFATGSYSELLQSLGALERCFELLDSDSESIEGRLLSDNDEALEIEFRNVSFAYPARPELKVLDSLSFVIPKGKTTALVGASGAGKSTVVQLVMKFYECSEGDIVFNNHSISHMSARSIRSSIAYVPQDSGIFGLSIAENLRLGAETATNEELERVLRAVQLWSLIESLPEGLNTFVGDKGVQLSGGQRQRLSIARALLKDPKLVILDEATSSLDSENEARVQDALKILMKGRTSLVIAHRLSTIKNASQVLVLANGALEQSGSYEELINIPGAFQTFAKLQELGLSR